MILPIQCVRYLVIFGLSFFSFQVRRKKYGCLKTECYNISLSHVQIYFINLFRNIPHDMDLSGKTFQSAQSFLQNASSLVSAYGLGSPFIAGQALTTSLYSGTSQALSNSIYSGSLATSLSSSHAPFSNGHSTTSPSAKMPDNKKSYASPAPVFNRHKDSFPYGISGVPIPNYGYQGDVYQFTSNGYPRKSRTCSYCGKVFTRSTTRRYHEKRCPLLRAAVSSYMGDDNNSGSALQSRVRGAELASHSFTGQGQSLPPSLSGIGRSNDPQELATSVLKSPPVSEKRVSGDLISGYQTSVIVKSEPHELEGSVLSSYSERKQSLAQESTENRLRFSPESAGSGHKLEPSLNLSSPGYVPGMDLTKSLSHTSLGHNRDSENITSVLNDNYLRERYKVQSDSELEMGRGQLPSISSLRRPELIPRSHASYSIDLTHENDTSEGTENRMEVPDVIGDSMIGRPNDDDDDDEFDRREKSEYNGPLTMESGEIDTTDREQNKVLGSHKCGICGKCFESSGKLHLHEQIHTKFRPYCCKFCGQRFAKSALRIAHEKTHNGVDTTHICAVCGSSFTRKYSLKLHMHRWHQEGPWLCRHCGKASLTQMELKTHLYSHNLPRMERESLLYMPDVPLNYGAAKDLDIDGQDIQEYNSSPGGGAAAQEGGDLSAQQETEMCTECGRDFPKGYMRYHLKSHEAQKPYSCPICAKRFGYKNNMKSHIKLHTGVKPFCCKVCGAKFTRGSTLRRHARRHGIIADSVWDLFVKSNYGTSSKAESTGKPLMGGKMDTSTTSNSSEGIATNPLSSSAKPGAGNVAGDTNYLDSSISPTTTHGTRPSLYPLYASLGQIPPPGLYPSLSTSTSYLQRLPHSLGYSASSHTPPQQMDALNLSLQKAHDQSSDQSSYSNMSMERSRSRSRSLSGSDNQRRPYSSSGKLGKRDIGVQVHTCCHNKEAPASQQRPPTPTAPPDAAGAVLPGTSTTPVPESPSQNMAVMPYIVTSPSQRPSNVDSTSPALSVSSIKDYSLETISSLISSGRMFKCFHCECYFSEYAMYRIHSKLHTRDTSRPFVCLVCGEDCYDRVYFALHLSEHLR